MNEFSFREPYNKPPAPPRLMTYKNGRVPKVGDQVLARTYAGVPFTAVVVKVDSELASGSCSLQVLPLTPTHVLSVDSAQTLHVEDVDAKPAQ
jgi:hypothetical protein